MFRTPPKTVSPSRSLPPRSARREAAGRITEIYQQGRRPGNGILAPEILNNIPNDSYINQPVQDSPLNVVSGPSQPINQQFDDQFEAFAARSLQSHHSVIPNRVLPIPVHVTAYRGDNRSQSGSHVSRLSRTQSEVLVLERQEDNLQQEFAAAQNVQNEMDQLDLQLIQHQKELDLQLLQRKKEQLLQRKKQTEEFAEKQKQIQRELDQKRMQLLEEEGNVGAQGFENLNQSQNVEDWLNNVVLPQARQFHQPNAARSIRSFRIQNNVIPPGVELNTNPPIQNPVRLQQCNSAPIIQQRDEVLSEAFKALQIRRIKELPSFSGDSLLDWPLFLNEFKTTTREQNIQDSDNLKRLQKALTGKARATVQPLLSNPCHVPRIIKILESNFGRTEWIMSKITHQLENMPVVIEDDLESMRNFYNQIYSLYHASMAVNGESYLVNPNLVVHLSEKLPRQSRHDWNRHKAQLVKHKKIPDLQHFLVWLEDELDIAFASFNPAKSKQRRFVERPRNVMTHTRSNNLSKCIYCKSTEHYRLCHCEKFKRLPIDERRQMARKLRICYICMEPGHPVKECSHKNEMKCSICGASHNKLLHKSLDRQEKVILTHEELHETETNDGILKSDSENVEEPTDRVEQQAELDETLSTDSFDCFANFNSTNVLLRIGKVKLYGPNGSISTYAIFDEGSQSTMLDETVAKSLGLKGTLSPVTYRWTTKITKHHPKSMKVNLKISGPNNGSKSHPLQARTIENLSLPQQNFIVEEIAKIYANIDTDKLKLIHNCTPRLLIGSDNASLITARKSWSYHDQGLQLSKCAFGWTIHGPIQPQTESNSSLAIHLAVLNTEDGKLEELIAEQYRVEQFGIINQNSTMSKDDTRALEIMQRTLRQVENHFEIGLPYRYENMKFPESKTMALKRLEFIERKMDKDEKYAKGYCDKIADYMTKQYLRKLNPSEIVENDKCWYLPHFGVYNVNKPGKFRLVMDAKAKSYGVSLNDLLLKGPDFVPRLLHVLWRARLHKVGFMADIAEMFHQVVIREQDRCSQRILFRGMNRDKQPDVYEMNVMIFGAVSSPSQAQFVKNQNAERLEVKYPGILRAIRDQHYVDDYVDYATTVEEANTRINNVIEAHMEGGFKLLKFLSNSPEVIAKIPQELRGEPNPNGIERVLGIQWDTNSDEYLVSFEIPVMQKCKEMNEPLTKRQMLRILMSVFDPLGLVQPIMIGLKILFQELWRKKIAWDDKIPNELHKRWNEWFEIALKIREVRVPRCYSLNSNNLSTARLHIMCDASDKGYASVAYLVVKNYDHYDVAFLQARSKVAPIKHLTIPRMELQACVQGTEMATEIIKEIGIPIATVYFWTDSKIVLNWFRTNEKLNAFVGSRVSKIFENEKFCIDNWHWIPSIHNVADLGTKTQKVDMNRWIKGPEFLVLDEQMWPDFGMPELDEDELNLFHSETIDQLFT